MPVFLSEMELSWNHDRESKTVADDYCNNLHASATLCSEAPIAFQPSGVKKALTLINGNRDWNDNLIKIEIPCLMLMSDQQAELG